VACKPVREGAPNMRVQLTVALALLRKGSCREGRGLISAGRPHLTRHPLGSGKS
jgi:hypothetical protein